MHTAALLMESLTFCGRGRLARGSWRRCISPAQFLHFKLYSLEASPFVGIQLARPAFEFWPLACNTIAASLHLSC